MNDVATDVLEQRNELLEALERLTLFVELSSDEYSLSDEWVYEFGRWIRVGESPVLLARRAIAKAKGE